LGALFFVLFYYEISKNKFKVKDYGEAINMSSQEKKISFLNRYFVYKKIRTVNIESIEIELGEYQETEALRDAKESEHFKEIAQEEVVKLKPKVRKLSKKILLMAATEAVDESIIPSEKEKEKEKINIKKVSKKPSKKILIIENLLNLADNIIIGGGMSYTFIKAQGGEIGNSLFEDERVELTKEILNRAEAKGVKIY
jgi:hypothetical protein